MAKKNKKNKDSDNPLVDRYKKAIDSVHTQLDDPLTFATPLSVESFDKDAIIQEANRSFFHPLGLCLVDDDGLLSIVEPVAQPKLEYGKNVKEEIANVKTVQEMRIINCKKRLKELGYKVQPVNTKF